MNKALPPIKESVAELEDRLRRQPDPRRKERLQLLLFIQNRQAHSRKDAARLLGRSRNTIGRWFCQYQQDGLDGLLDLYQPSGQTGQRTLPDEVYEALKTKLDQAEGFGGYLHLLGWLQAEHNLVVNYETLRKLVRREFGAKLKVPRPVHEKKNTERAGAFPGELAALLAIIAVGGLALRLFACDESRFGLLPIKRRRLTSRGVKPVQRFRWRFEYCYLYGAVEPRTGESFLLEMPSLNSLCFQVFLDEFARVYSESLNVVVLDNGSFHKAQYLIVPENVILVFLPPYCPELNPIERLWQDVKDQLALCRTETMEALQGALSQVLRGYSETMVASLCGSAYMLNALNALS